MNQNRLLALVLLTLSVIVSGCDPSTAPAYTPTKPPVNLPTISPTDAPTPGSAAQNIVDLIEQGAVTFKITSGAINELGLVVQNTTGQPQQIDIPAGTFFVSSDPETQNMVVLHQASATVQANGQANIQLEAACANLHLNEPTQENTFTIQRTPKPLWLTEVISRLNSAEVDYPVAQAAVWIMTDDATFDELGLLVKDSRFGTSIINETDAVRAMTLVEAAGFNIRSYAIWQDRMQLLAGVTGTDLSAWLGDQVATQVVEEATLAVEEATLIAGAAVQATRDATLTPPSIPTVEPTKQPQIAPACQAERVLIIVLDGVRPDAIWNTPNAPFIKNLALENGSYTWNGLTVAPSLTIPAFTSLITGYDVPVHGITRNDLHQVAGEYLKTKSLFQYAKDHQMVTALVSGKDRLGYFIQPGALDEQKIYKKMDSLTVANYVSDLMSKRDFGLMAVDFGFADVQGHATGWMSDQYLSAVQQADQAVKQVFTKLTELNTVDSTLVVILADHGGLDLTHANNRPEDETIPWILLGPCVKQGFELPSEPRVRIFDTTPTIFWALGWEIPPDFSGRVIKEAFETGDTPEPASP